MSSTPLLKCPRCTIEIAPEILCCPACSTLIHAQRLKQLAGDAESATQNGNLSSALSCWRDALELLPDTTTQYQVISDKIAMLGQQIRSQSEPSTASIASKWHSRGTLALIVAAVIFVATKAKILLFGLGKLSTILSMLATVGAYWTMWGWQFALGLVASIYVHEMGHVVALKRYGIAATPPMFIPGLGAFVRMKQNPANTFENAEVGLAGPVWGLAAALACFLTYKFANAPLFGALAHTGAVINLFNMTPIIGLDGDRGFCALTRNERLVASAVIAGVWYFTQEGILLLVLIVAIMRSLAPSLQKQSDKRILIKYCLLVIALAALSMLSASQDLLAR